MYRIKLGQRKSRGNFSGEMGSPSELDGSVLFHLGRVEGPSRGSPFRNYWMPSTTWSPLRKARTRLGF